MWKKSLLTLIFASLLAVVLFITVPTEAKASTNGHTQAEAVQWARDQIGIEYGQCVQLVYSYYVYLGQPSPGGHAYSFMWNDAHMPSGWSEASYPEPGDIAVWDAYAYINPYWQGDEWGHVEIVTDVYGDGTFRSVSSNLMTDYYDPKVYYTDHSRRPINYVSRFIRPDFGPTTCELDVNGYYNGQAQAGLGDYATVDVKINGNVVATNVNDFCTSYNRGASYEITNLKVADGASFDGYSTVARAGHVSGGRTGTLNSHTDVRLIFHTVDAAGFVSSHNPAATAAYNGHSYYFYNTPVTWYEAKLVCEQLGGHLVTITNADENAFVKGLIGDSACWIGATDKDKEGTWKWVSGETFSYSKWYGSSYGGTEPNNDSASLEGAENYAHIRQNSDTWNDNSGCFQCSFVCEIDKAYTISYNANGGPSAPSNQTKIHGVSLKLSSIIPEQAGYEFLSWNTKADGSGTSYAPGANYGTNASMTLYAIWESLTYTISYDANGGTGAPQERTVEGGGTITLPTDVPTREGHDFLGWDPDPDAKVATYLPGGNYPGGQATLYAIWEIQHLNVIFSSEGEKIDDRVVDYGNALGELLELQREGYFFKGWYDGNTKVTASTIVTSSLSLVARWSEPAKMVLPAAITTVENEAFYGVDTNVFVIPSGVTTIGSKAFANNPGLYSVFIYANNVTLAPDAFANCPNLTIYGHEDSQIHYYAVAKNIPFVPLTNGTSDWVPYSEMPVGATIVEEKWGYDHVTTETTTSTEPTMDGWTEDSTKRRWEQTETGVNKYVDFSGIDFLDSHALYGKYNNKMTNQEDATTKTEITGQSSNAGYIYYHWTLEGRYPQDAINAGHAINVDVFYHRGHGDIDMDYTLFHAFEVDSILSPVDGATRSNDHVDLTGEGIYSTCYTSAEYNLAQYVSYWWYITEIRQQPYTKYQRIFTFTRQTTEPMESTTPVVEGDDITNVKHYVKYGF